MERYSTQETKSDISSVSFSLTAVIYLTFVSTSQINTLTLEWRDGLMALSVRDAVSDTSDDHKWVICDGPVDALWIENMNTVLDDNKMLCLANSERIKLTPSIHMVFEVRAKQSESGTGSLLLTVNWIIN